MSAPAFDRRMLEALVCPQTQATLTYDADRQELVSRAAHLAYPIRDGIPGPSEPPCHRGRSDPRAVGQ